MRVQAWQYRRLLSGDGVWNRANPKHIVSELSERYKRSVLNQVVAGLSSWESLTQDVFREHVTKSTLPEDVKYDLYRVNAAKAWYKPTYLVSEPVEFADGDITYMVFPVPPATLKLARRIVKHIKVHRNRLPNLARSRTMHLDGPVAVFEPSRSPTFPFWVRISTLTKGKPVRIPVRSHRFADEADGTWAALTQITVNPDRSIVVKHVKKSPDAPARCVPAGGAGSVGVDFGLVCLFGTDRGDLFGHAFYPWLVERDTELVTLSKHLQRQGRKPTSSSRYRALQHRISAYVDNEINRVLNRLITVHNPAEIVVERLDFRGGGLSRSMNRLITRAGRAAVKAKLEAVHETLGITITVVPAAHTSRECSGCGFVAATNRTSRGRFECGFCGKKRHADVNAGCTIRSRRSWPEQYQYASRTKLLAVLDSAFATRWGVHPDVIRERNRVQAAGTARSRPITDGLALPMGLPAR